MAKFYGPIGFAVTSETRPGVWTEAIVERQYYGDVLRYNHRLQYSDKVNGDFTISQEISIMADPFAYENVHSMRYIGYAGTQWEVTSAEIDYPRIKLTIGGIYHVDTTGGTESNSD